MLDDILFYLLILLCYIRVVLRTTEGLHILQLDGYKPIRYMRWVALHPRRCFEVYEVLVVVITLTVVSVFEINQPAWLFAALCVCWIAFQIYRILWRKKEEAKKPLVYTARAKRLFSTTLTCQAFIAVLIALTFSNFHFQWRLSAFLFCELTVPVLVICSNLILPLEFTINNAYLRDAKKRIRNLKPKIIGITGSYGKTSTKYILNQILSKEYNVLMTPNSYNTPMGICKVIRGELTSEHEFFIVEMGAYRRGDIKELCQLAPPDIGILTAVGPQHLERFKSLENTAKAKYELIEALPTDGLAVINSDNEICAALADKTVSVPVNRYSVNRYSVKAKENDDTIDIRASDIKHSQNGLSFTVSAADVGNVEITTRLLGKHNVSNILAAIAVSLYCGMTLKDIQAAIRVLQPVPHRLELKPADTGVIIIDDSFNSNPEGAKAALEVLTDFVNDNDSKKVLVTPGMVELGEREYDENKKLGTHAAKVCDLVILVGDETTGPILDGLKHENYPEHQIHKVKNLAEVQLQLAKNLKAGDVVLFENDLPDNYN